MDAITEAVLTAVGRRLAVWHGDDHTVVATPWTLDDQTPVTLYITQLSSDVFNVSDAGLAAGALADAGVDLTRKAVGSSFLAVRNSLRFPPPMGDESGKWDVAVTVSADRLGDAVIEVSEAVIRAETLKALGSRRKPRTFGERIMRTATEIGLTIEPQAPLPLRHRGARRRVSYRVANKERDAFVQTITQASTATGYDHAKALFTDTSIDEARRITALEQTVRLDPWQYEGLSEVSRVITEQDLGSFLANNFAA